MKIDWCQVTMIRYPQLEERHQVGCEFCTYDKDLFVEFHRFMMIAFEDSVSAQTHSSLIGVFLMGDEIEQVMFILNQLGITPDLRTK